MKRKNSCPKTFIIDELEEVNGLLYFLEPLIFEIKCVVTFKEAVYLHECIVNKVKILLNDMGKLDYAIKKRKIKKINL